MNLLNLIQSRLDTLTSSNEVTILYACESGSRAWGFPSPDSDYDIRFIYAHPLPWYLTVQDRRDVIESPLEKNPLGELDMGGWDIKKALGLARKSNPVIWEWLQSPILYRTAQADFAIQMRECIDPFFSPISACHHYLSICLGTMDRELTGETVRIKKYFYMLRPLLAAMWVEEKRTVPPMEFEPLMELIDRQQELVGAILDLQERKNTTDERIPVPHVPIIDTFLHNESARLKIRAEHLPKAKGSTDTMDAFLQRTLGLS